MIGTIKISDLKILSKLGVYPEERKHLQEINLDILFKIDISRCVETDSIQDTVNYEDVCLMAKELFANKAYFLIEKFAYELACLFMKKFPLIELSIEVKKKEAIPHANYASISLSITKEEFRCLGS